MSQKIGMEVSIALGEAAKLADTDVVAAYPITPQTHIVEHIADMVANGEMDAEFVTVESEHSAMSACLGSAAVGARTFTATAGQGLELMHEVLFVASASRLPIVMTVANRALSGPLNIWGDHSDVMAARDCGWIQYFAENGQEAFDLTLCAFRIAEDPAVLLPIMIHVDGFHLTHVVEPITLLEKSDVDKFIPPIKYPYPLRPDKPVTIGAFAPPFIYTETKRAEDNALRNSKKVILATWKEFNKLFGRSYKPVETYRTEDARILLMTMGSFSETAMVAVDNLREKGEKIGLIHLRLWRPFPFAELREAVGNAATLLVLDRAVSVGGPGGPVCSEVRSAFYEAKKKPDIIGFVGGLGGRDLSPNDFEYMVRRGKDILQRGEKQELEMIGVRE
jgi:pyruvate ferredoxin oxidoreductase alpha subunit